MLFVVNTCYPSGITNSAMKLILLMFPSPRLQNILQAFMMSECTTSWVRLAMNPVSWLANREKFPKSPGIYSMWSICPKEPQCIRVGIGAGKLGIYGRWFHSVSSHYRSFLEPQVNNGYHDFYTQMAFVFPEVDVVFIEHPTSCRYVRTIEKKMIAQCHPIWEQRHRGKLIWKQG